MKDIEQFDVEDVQEDHDSEYKLLNVTDLKCITKSHTNDYSPFISPH